ncbi:MAG TPA: cysteine desulfurase NifS [Terriglobia bacterium]|nr:cysteine desulfurase NifS [Terriglobia bacterium]
MPSVYLDNNATTPVAPEVAEAMWPYLHEEFGNASSVHEFGQRAREAVERARAQVAALINAQPAEIVFTSGGTESDNLAVLGAVEAARHRSIAGRKHVISTPIEHPAVLYAARMLERRQVDLTYLPMGRGGVVDLADVQRALRTETILISVMLANNEIGTLQPIAEIGRLARERHTVCHTDAVQAVGKVPVDVEKLGVDLLSLSAHKLYGPKGVGALYARKGTRLEPLMHGGHHERDRRPGTENVPGIVGLGAAAELAAQRLEEDTRRIAALRDRLQAGILERVEGVRVNGDAAHRQPNTLNVSFQGVKGEAVVMALDLEGVACSTGSACASGSVEPSHVLTAIGLSPDEARGSIRLSLGRYNTEADVEAALEAIPSVVKRLRALSPRYAHAGTD